MLREIILYILGVLSGGIISWLVTRYYYRRTLIDDRENFLAQRLDDCTEGDMTFLVAMLQAEGPIPRYALINVEFETIDGRKDGWGGDTFSMARSVNSRTVHSIQFHRGSHIDEDLETISLTDRGIENAKYLVLRKFKSARFTRIGDADAQRLSLFKNYQEREPQKRSV